MKKVLPALLAILLLLTACGGSSKSNSSMDMSMPTEDKADYDSGWNSTAGEMAPMEPESSPTEPPVIAPDMGYLGSSVDSPLPANAKMIYTADLSLETKEFAAAAKALDEIVESLGGYYESHSLHQGGSYRSLTCTIRVPAEHFEDLLYQAGQSAHATYCQRYSDNVGEAYYDTEARLQTQRTKLDRLHALLEKAATMEDIIALENALSDTELQIEYLTGSLRRYDSLIGYSTVNVTLEEVYKLSTDGDEAPATFGQRLSGAFALGFRRGIDNMEDLVVDLARNWMGLVVWAVVLTAAALVLRRWIRRRKHRDQAARSTAVSAPAGDNAPKN